MDSTYHKQLPAYARAEYDGGEGRGGEGRGACRSLSDSMRGLQNVVRPHALQDPVDTKKIMCLATPVLCPLMLQAPL